MYDGYQVLRFENNYKSKDLYLIGNEMNNRVGTGNYNKERTKFNIKYKELEKDNLYQDVKYKLESRNIEYLHKTKTNLLNGVTISSGPEFFMTLGLPFKETDRKYKTGKKEGQNIWTPDIKSKDDIPEEVIKYFDESYNFLKKLVGEENIVIAQVHFDEDTLHLQAYFLPVVNEVKRKCYQRDKVKSTTLYNYRNMMPYLEPLFNIKVESFNIRHFELWRQSMNEKKISTRYKNGVYKYLKAVMNFGTKWYDLNFVKVYNKMTNFTNPNERKKEMSFYTPEEFQKFLSVENDVKFICAFQTLFYCGLRNGELRGLTWNDINFRKSCLSVNKNITKTPDPITGKPYTVSSPKTMSSYRTIPIPNFLLEYYKDLYDNCSSYYNFNDNWYVFGNIDPLPETTLRDRKTKNAFKAGVKDIRVHDFRHSCASLLIDSGANITLVAKYLGHSKIDETLNTYSHMYQNRLENIVQIIEVQNTKLLESKQKELPEPKETIIDYEDTDYYDYDEDLDNKKEDDLVL